MLSVAIFYICTLLLAAFYLILRNKERKFQGIPKVFPRWPFFGNVFSLDFNRTHIMFTEFSKRYGPIFRIKLYNEEVVVLNDYHSIVAALVTNGSDVAGRPYMYRTEQAKRNKNSIVWQTYTPKLKLLRKEVHRSLKMYHGAGLENLETRCKLEMEELLKRIDSYDGDPFDPWSLFYDATCNVMLLLLMGTRFQYNDPEFYRIKEINKLFNHTFGSGSGKLLDVIPWPTWLGHRGMSTLQKALYMRNQFWNAQLPKIQENGVQTSVVGSLLNLKKVWSDNLQVDDETVKEVFTNLILAGTDTTTTALTCLLLIFLHFPNIQQQIHNEIDKHVPNSHLPTLQDRDSMPYLEATLLEVLRYISHVPLAVPHATICDTIICGKHIPKDTTVYINLWAVHHDETFWEEPWKFHPERFLDSTGALLPPQHQNRRRVLAFGAGRRICLGESLAKNRLFLFASSLLQQYKFIPDGDNMLPDLDPRTYNLGLVLHPEPFKVRAVPRRLTS